MDESSQSSSKQSPVDKPQPKRPDIAADVGEFPDLPEVLSAGITMEESSDSSWRKKVLPVCIQAVSLYSIGNRYYRNGLISYRRT